MTHIIKDCFQNNVVMEKGKPDVSLVDTAAV